MAVDVAAFSVFAVVATITPGPNNIMLASSGAAFGFRRSIPHMLGIAIGFPVMVALVALGLGPLLSAYPLIHQVMQVVGAAFLFYLSWRIFQARRARLALNAAGARPLSFWQAAAFQWVNPKGWQMALAAVTAYATPTPGSQIPDALTLSLIFFAAAWVGVTPWVWLGMKIEALLTTENRRAWFFGALAGSLALSVIPTFL